jgi:hypothetical protein
MVQLKSPIHNVEAPYELKNQIRVTNCLFARFSEKEENLQYAYSKLQLHAFDQIKQYKEQGKVKKDQIYYDTILSFTNERKQLEMEKSKLETQKESISKATDEYKLYAQRRGMVRLNAPLKKGMVLQGGSL